MEHGTNGRWTLGGVFNLKYQRKRERKKKEKKDKLEAQNAIKNYKGSMQLNPFNNTNPWK